jgi:hypothetical protein
MSFRRRHRWTRRILLGLAAGILAVPAQARPLESASVSGEAAKTTTSASAIPDAFERAVNASLAAEPLVIPYLSQGLGVADAVDPRTGIPLSAGIPVAGDEFVVTETPTAYTIEPGRSWYLVTDPTPARPDDRVDRFVVGDVPPATPVTADDGFALDWENGITVGLGALVLGLAVALGITYMRRPRVAM